jgi:hypothetical protein
MTPDQQKAYDDSVAFIQRTAVAIVALPAIKREDALRAAERALKETLVIFDQDSDLGRVWLNLQLEGLRALVREMGTSGGKAGGNA